MLSRTTKSTKATVTRAKSQRRAKRGLSTTKHGHAHHHDDHQAVHHSSQYEKMDGDVAITHSFADYPIGTRSPHHLRHNGPSAGDITEMLKVIGADSVDGLMAETIPGNIQTIKRLAAGQGASEVEALASLKSIMGKNKIFQSYIGKGYYGTLTPNVILRNIIENPAWYTPYTPYQAEIAQGRLEMLLNYQTVCGDLTGLPVASASLLDEGTAAAEALTMLWDRSKRKTVLVDSNTHVQTLDVIKTRATGFGWTVKLVDLAHMDASVDDDTFAVFVSYPGSDGSIDSIPAKCKSLKAKHSHLRLAVASDLMALAVVVPPGEFGADACVGTSQRFGVPMGYGGPHAAFLTTTNDYIRKMPGRIIGVSKDARGEPALRMAIQTREQHIRRERASSNICTAQALLANVAAAYAVHHGAPGIKYIAQTIHSAAATAAKHFKTMKGVTLNHEQFFDTLSLNISGHFHEVLNALEAHEMNVHVDGHHTIHIAFDEANATAAKVSKLLSTVSNALGGKAIEIDHLDINQTSVGHDLMRTSAFLTHPVFNKFRSETAMLRYLYSLQQKDLSLATAAIPLGSCTMKLNATAEMIPITWPEVNNLHPFAGPKQTLGYQELADSLSEWLCNITGFDAFSLQPNSGAQGEYAGLQTILAYHQARGQNNRNVCLIPASAHGTNPASAALAGLKVVVVNCDAHGNIDVADLKIKAKQYENELAAIQITYPSTHGVFETSVKEICDVVHQHGGQVYLDGANMNAQVGWTSPGDIGADVCHLNLHKTFCIPHGGGGPGMGPIGVRAHLAEFLPRHAYLTEKTKIYHRENAVTDVYAPTAPSEPAHGPVVEQAHTISGAILPQQKTSKAHAVSAAPIGSASILPISWMYIKMLGGDGLRTATQTAILNANYLMSRLKNYYPVLFTGENGRCAHEFIIDMRAIKKATGISEEDIAKRLVDYGFHAPTMSFPVPGTLMIEPTESEPLSELNRLADAFIGIRGEIDEIQNGTADPINNVLKNAPHTADVCLSDSWDRPYSREKAAYPIRSLRQNKFWPTVGRLDNVFGDKNLTCSCYTPDFQPSAYY